MINRREKIAVAMSGGVDSSVAAALAVELGAEVVGLTARMWKEGSHCCSREDIEAARRVCDHLGIRHVVINARDAFSRCVVDRFAAEYARGRTPSPCVVCNQIIKFGLLLTRAVEFGCDKMITGHYARLEKRSDGFHLLKGEDSSRDQSYFLHRLSQRQLARSAFPLGDMIKRDDVEEYAERLALPLRDRKESRDVCFVADGHYAELVENIFPGMETDGPLVNADGERIGVHSGFHRYTVGQRKGLGVAGGEPLYVVAIEPESRTVRLGRRSDAMSDSCLVEDPRWIAGKEPREDRLYGVKIRYRSSEAYARLHMLEYGRLRLEFEEPQFAVTPGQAAVVYEGDEVLGGGWISSG